ncbi:MAG: hypothetical protein JWM93_1608 [Frankiales bacterium]|nr:hypothetical protein [Frankiales bacterium]
MDQRAFSETLCIARAFDSQGWLPSSDWVNVCIALLVHGVDDPDVTALACLVSNVTGWDTDGPAGNLYERYSVSEPNATDAVTSMAQALAADLRSRPANVTSPMVRLLAKVAGPHYESDLANRAMGAEEYLDCNCIAHVDDSSEMELEGLPPLGVPDDVVRLLTARLRITLPTIQPPHSH